MKLLGLIQLTKSRLDSQNTEVFNGNNLNVLRSYSALLYNLIQHIVVREQLQYPIQSVYLLLIKMIESLSLDNVPSLITLLKDVSSDPGLSESYLNECIHGLLGCSVDE